ncbi:aspartate ammonia-lyase [Candidatus Woesearchaeota archaeon]|nr:aspartate ammonia-lyase [Candidatus Woesearchaeota archaeon]
MRIEKDVLGKVNVPDRAFYGSFTARAMHNFQISPYKVHPQLIFSQTIIKKAAAKVNAQLHLLDKKYSNAIVVACDEILSGKYADQFSLDVFQAGAGTPINMNVNEVIANRANQLLGAKLGSYKFIHPNNHVNMAQSTNDTIPTALAMTTLFLLKKLHPELVLLEKSLQKKAQQFKQILKTGRTHHEDAVPITLGQEFAAYAETVKNAHARIYRSSDALLSLGIGGTAVGTGITAHPQYAQLVVKELGRLTKTLFVLSKDSIQKTQNVTDFAAVSSSLSLFAQDLYKITEDLAWLNSGPQAGIAEITLPEVEPGSSIMPGKINPSIIEAVHMVCFEIMGNNHSIAWSSTHSLLELNVYTPLIGFKLFESIELLTRAAHMLRIHCIDGIVANKKRCEELLYKSTAVATALNPYLGYSLISSIVHEALQKDKSIKEVILEKKLVDKKDLDIILSPKSMTRPGKIDKKLVENIKKNFPKVI